MPSNGFFHSIQAVLVCIHLLELMGTGGKAVGGVYPSPPSNVKVMKTWRCTSTAPTRLYDMAYNTGINSPFPLNQMTTGLQRTAEKSCRSLSLVLWTMDIVECKTSIK